MAREAVIIASILLCLADRILGAQTAYHYEGGTVEAIEGQLLFTRPPDAAQPATNSLQLISHDRLRTLEYSRATVRWEDRTILRMAELTTIELRPAAEEKRAGVIRLLNGAIRWFSRQRSADLDFETPHAVGGARGTEFEIVVNQDRTILRVFDGEAELRNPEGTLTLSPGEAGIVSPGRAPYKMRIEATNLVQWWLFYPAVLDPEELVFPQDRRAQLMPALEAYREGDLRAALHLWPADLAPDSTEEKAFLASLLLAAGTVEQTTNLLRQLPPSSMPGTAVRWLIAAVNRGSVSTADEPRCGSGWLAWSYYLQSQRNLEGALSAAKEAVKRSPGSGFAWTRLADMEFSFGRLPEAESALRRALETGPKNAQAHALRGSVLAAQSRFKEAQGCFQNAIALDPGLANGWLGRGLCRFRSGDHRGGLEDLQVAAAVEPERSLLRSYLGKAWAQMGETLKAGEELSLARKLDPKDPTPWLYSAVVAYEENRANEAVRDLEQSMALNDNRGVYRSALLLKEDQAVRGTTLARIYQRAGLNDVSLREAARAESYDYSSYSTHLFMADSFYGLLDPTRFNLRYYSAWVNELLLGSLLSPASAGAYFPRVSQQEYSPLLESRGLGFGSTTEARSDGQVRQTASQFGAFSKTSYSIDLDYQYNQGVRPNNDLERLDLSFQVKQEIGLHDTLSFVTRIEDYSSGDNFQYYDPDQARPYYRFDEQEIPILLGGWRHEWTPGSQTLGLGGRLVNDQKFTDQGVPEWVLDAGGTNYLFSLPYNVGYENRLEVYLGEVQQILSLMEDRNTLIIGGRFQTGNFEARDNMASSDPLTSASATNHVDEDFVRYSVYAYDYWTIRDRLVLIAGLSYDLIDYPANYRHPPVNPGQEHIDSFSPKAALIWSPSTALTLRGIYSRGLSGVSLDGSYRLEPAQLAGFTQSYQAFMPESVVGSVSAQKLEQAGGAMDLKLPNNTYIGIQAESAWSSVDREIGVFGVDLANPPAMPASTSEELRYHEISAGIGVNKLIANNWSIGGSYRFVRATLNDNFPSIDYLREQTADLHELRLALGFNHPSGFFGALDGLCVWQTASGYQATPDESVQQANVRCGWRFRRNHGEIAAGILNLGGDDYRLNPLNAYWELPRERVFFGRLVLNF
jgi:tetratricopeptide (TPR) repeat protein